MTKPLKYFLLIIIIFAFSSCKIFRPAGAAPKLKKRSAEFLAEKAEANKISFQTFSGKAKMNVKSPESSQSFTANIRMDEDSIIWISVTAVVGMEVARALITPDSVKVIDRINKKYFLSDFSYIQNRLPFPVDIKLLQKLIIGEKVFFNPDELTAEVDSQYYVLTSEAEGIRNKMWITDGLYLIARMLLQHIKQKHELDAYLENYQSTSGRRFAYSRKYLMPSKKVEVQMDFSKIAFDETLSYPFSIPEKYELAE